MARIIDPDRDRSIHRWLDGRFLRFRRDPHRVAAADEVEITSAWRLCNQAPETALVKRTIGSLRSFCETCMDVGLCCSSDAGLPAGTITFAVVDGVEGGEAFTLDVHDQGVVLRSGSETGLLRGVTWILRQFAANLAPILRVGSVSFGPAFHPRIANTVFSPSVQRLQDDLEIQYSDAYLSLLSFHDVSGVHLYVNLWDLAKSRRVPELCAEEDEYAANMASLRRFCARAGEYGVGAYLLINTPVLPAEHICFQSHPEMRGARVSVESVHIDGHCLCTSTEQTVAFFEETLANLFIDAPALAGIILIVGGECFYHCYMRPAPPFTGRTNCPRCQRRNPSENVANLVNRIAQAVTDVRSGAQVFCWPYSAFTWSGSDKAQIELIRHLSPSVLFLSDWATGDIHPNTGAVLYDYNIEQIGPTSCFLQQTEALEERGSLHYAKIEAATTSSMFQFPYLPVHFRWGRRAAEMRSRGVAGYVSHWRFYGFTGSLPEEILSESVWSDVALEEVLERYCRREYREFSSGMLTGWRIMSEAWDYFPYSATFAGGSQSYMKGPLYLGPAHPFIFDAQKHYGLSRGFMRLQGYAAEDFSEETLEEQERRYASPCYVSDLLWSLPIGVDRTIALLEQLVCEWRRGVEVFERAFASPNAAAEDEIGICRVIGTHFETCLYLARFLKLRDRFFSGGLDGMDEMNQLIEQMQRIVLKEIRNAERAIPLLERDVRLGYGYCYGVVYDAQMVREKIAQCRFIVQQELPLLAKSLRFHLYNVFP